jgi:hypothetical protein
MPSAAAEPAAKRTEESDTGSEGQGRFGGMCVSESFVLAFKVRKLAAAQLRNYMPDRQHYHPSQHC